MMKRRDALELLSLPLLGALACGRKPQKTMSTQSPVIPSPAATSPKMPVLFLAHGAPMLMDDAGWVGELAAWARAFRRPTSVLMVSAHWEQGPVTLGATTTVPLTYDFSGFPERFYQVKYPAPGAPALAERVRGLVRDTGMPVANAPTRGLDHGAYVPLLCMYPEANVPVLQLSMPSLNPQDLFALGKAIAPLRDEGVLVVGSGFITHNMRLGFQRGTPSWAREFDAWTADVIARGDVDALLDFGTRAPAAHTALPTTEHFAPLILAAGAVAHESPPVTFPITGFWMDGAFTRRSVQFG